MNCLLDTNIFLEILLAQERATQAEALLTTNDVNRLNVSDFSLHSIGLILFRRNAHDVFRQFLKDVMRDDCVEMVGLFPYEMELVGKAAQRFGLDFDDAYQYAVSEKYDLVIVSFDAHFDTTDRARKEPDSIVGS